MLHKKVYTSLGKDTDPNSISIIDAVKLIEEKRKTEAQKHIKTFSEDPKLEVLNGRYGPYLAYDGKNIRLPKAMHERAQELTYDECMAIVNKN